MTSLERARAALEWIINPTGKTREPRVLDYLVEALDAHAAEARERALEEAYAVCDEVEAEQVAIGVEADKREPDGISWRGRAGSCAAQRSSGAYMCRMRIRALKKESGR